MPPQPRTPEHIAKLAAGRRHAFFDAIADPLWRAIAAGRTPEVERLTAALQTLITRHREREGQHEG